MKGFAVLLALASVSLLLICGPPAVAQGDENYILQSDSISSVGTNTDIAENLPAAAVGRQGVPDPGSCSGHRATRNIFRQGVRLLNFLPCC